MLRTIICALYVVIVFIISLPILGIEWLIARKWPNAGDRSFLHILQGFSRGLLFLSGVKLTVKGKENIPPDEPVLYIGNHRSLFDLPLTIINCPGPTGYIAKKELEKVPVLNIWIRRLHGYFIDREDVRNGLKVILASIDQVKNNHISMFIFPEGTRNRNADETELLEFHEGSFKIATKSGCRIVPVAISGSQDIFEGHFPYVYARRIIVEYGNPIDPKELTGDDKKFIGRYVRSLLTGMLKKNEKEL